MIEDCRGACEFEEDQWARTEESRLSLFQWLWMLGWTIYQKGESMKWWWVLAGAIVLMAGVGRAEEDHSRNPDRHASVAVDFSNGVLDGSGVNTEYLYSGFLHTNVPIEDRTAGEVSLWAVTPSVRLPMTNSLTVELAMTKVHQDYDYSGALTRLHGSLRGEIYRVGFRYYFQD